MVCDSPDLSRTYGGQSPLASTESGKPLNRINKPWNHRILEAERILEIRSNLLALSAECDHLLKKKKSPLENPSGNFSKSVGDGRVDR